MRDLTIAEMDFVSGGGGSADGCYEPCAPEPPSCKDPCRPSCQEPAKKCGLLGGLVRLIGGIL